MGHMRPNPASPAGGVPRQATGSGGQQSAQAATPGGQRPPSAPRAIVSNAYSSATGRWLWALLAFGLACLAGYAAYVSVLTGHAVIIMNIGFGRILEAAGEIPAIRPLVPIIVAVEHLLTALLLVWVAAAFGRDVPPPKPLGAEILVFAGRQVKYVRWSLAAKGAVALLVGNTLATEGAGLLQSVNLALMPLQVSMPPPNGGVLLICGGFLELMGMQWLFRAAAVYCVPALRMYLVVIVDPQDGFCNRLAFGDGRLTRSGRRVIPHWDLLDAVQHVGLVRGRLLGLSTLVLRIRDDRLGEYRIAIDSPGSVAETARVTDVLLGPFRKGRRPDQTTWQQTDLRNLGAGVRT